MSENELGWFREDVCSAPPFRLPNHFRLRNPLIVEKMILDIIQEYQQKLPYYETHAKGLFTQLWVHLLEHAPVLTNWETLLSVKRYMSHQLDRDLTADELAGMANMSKYYFIRTFRGAFGVTPVKYHQMMRIEKAKELIQFTSLAITEIAEKLGFPGIHSFSRTFRKIEGVPPTFYRRRNG